MNSRSESSVVGGTTIEEGLKPAASELARGIIFEIWEKIMPPPLQYQIK
jgi:hypothetical protein